MGRRAFIFLYLFIPAILFSQEYDVEWSSLERKNGSLIYTLPNTEDSTEFYALRWTGGRMFGHYKVSRHKNLELVSSGKIRLYAEESMAYFEGARLIGGKLVIFLSDMKDGEKVFFMQKYNEEIEPEGESIRLASFEVDRRGAKKGWFDIRMSANNEFFGVIWQIPGKRQMKEVYGFKIFDTDLKEVNEGEYPIPFEPEFAQINAHHISNSGDYFLALSEYEINENRQIFAPKYAFKALHIYHVAPDGTRDFVIEAENKRGIAMAMTSDDNNIFTITGVYGEKGQKGVSGVVYEQVDLNTGKSLKSGLKEFDKEFITQGWTDRAKSRADRRERRGKGEPELYNYQMKEAVIMADGSIVGTLEQYYVQVRTSYDARTGQSSSTYVYYYNDIVAYKIDSTGNFDWVQKIPKSQISTNDGGPFSSYESFIDDGQIHFIFNDNDMNYNETGVYELGKRLYSANYSKKKNVVALASLDLENGDVNRRTFFDRSEINAIAVPKLFDVDPETGKMIMYAIWGYSKEKFGILDFKD